MKAINIFNFFAVPFIIIKFYLLAFGLSTDIKHICIIVNTKEVNLKL